MRKKDAIELGITVVLGILLLIVSFALIHKKKSYQGPRLAGSVPVVFKVKGLPQGHELHRKQVKGIEFFKRFSMVTAVLPLERDPFIAGEAGPHNSKAALVLDGIMWDLKKPTAVIGSNFFNEGDTIDRYKIVKILPTKVVLQDGDSRFELVLNQSI